ncbi:MAG: acyltransferase [Alphaproteobacteria bacterium]
MNKFPERLETIDALRAFAAVSVCLFHFTNGRSSLAPAFGFGVRGIEIFFVISGFVIPFALARAGYTLRAWPQFIAKRIVRIDPPYLASVAIVLALGLATMVIRGKNPTWTVDQIVSHVAFMSAALGYDWLNIVYWTLAIELQFYLLVSVLFPALVGPGVFSGSLILATCLVLAAIGSPSRVWITPYLPVFAAGLAAFWLRTGRLGPFGYGALIFATAMGLTWLHTVSVALASALTSIAIACLTIPKYRIFSFFGAISYPLYLLHVPVGGRIIDLASHLPQTKAVQIGAIIIALLVSVVAAWVLHEWIERPSMEIAARIRYSSQTVFGLRRTGHVPNGNQTLAWPSAAHAHHSLPREDLELVARAPAQSSR